MKDVYDLTSEEIKVIETYSLQIADLQRQQKAACQMLLASARLEGNWDYREGKLYRNPPLNLQPLKMEEQPKLVVTKPGDTLSIAAIQERDVNHNLERAIKLCDEAISKGVTTSIPYLVKASCLGFKGYLSKGLEVLDIALDRFPKMEEEIRHERSFLRLRSGMWQQGWEDWEFRNTRKQLKDGLASIHPDMPWWDGDSDIPAKALLVQEGGIGDAIMYMRWLPILASMGIESVLIGKNKAVCDIAKTQPGIWDAYHGSENVAGGICSHIIALYSLPHLLGVPIPPPPIRLPMHWDPFGEGTAPRAINGRFGIAWMGDPTAIAAHWRPTNLDLWKPVLDVADHHNFIVHNLEKDLDDDRLHKEIKPDISILDFAEYICSLDFVVTADCMVAHLCGCLGIPTFMVLHKYGYWPWDNRVDYSTVWYPNIRIFKMGDRESWTHVFERVADHIKDKFMI